MRQVFVGVAGSVLVLGCADDTPPTTGVDAHALYTASAWPALGACVGCHAHQPTVAFLAPGTPEGAYETIFAFDPPVVDLATPAASLVLTMGKHTGPPLAAPAATAILAWLEKERDERLPPPVPPIEFGPITPAAGAPITVDLGLGAHLALEATAVDQGLYLTQLAIVAGSGGLHVTHPLFVSHPAPRQIVPDSIDRFGDVDARLGASESLALGGGDAWFLDFGAADPISIDFQKLEAP